MLERGLKEEAQAEIEVALQRCKDTPGADLRRLTEAYVRATVYGLDSRYRMKRNEQNPFSPLLQFVERNSWLLRRDLSWLRVMFRINARLPEQIAIDICTMALNSRPDTIAELQTLIDLATQLRSSKLFIEAAELLRPLVERGSEARPEEDCLLWCQIGDAYLLAHDLEAAETCYRTAAERVPDDGRALLGLASVHLDRGDLAAAITLGRKASEGIAATGKTAQADVIAAAVGLWAKPERPVNSYEVMIFCHVTRKLKRNLHLAAPSIALVETAVRTLRDVVGLSNVPITVNYDHQPTELNNEFLLNLVPYCRDQGVSLVINTQHGLRRQWLQAFERSKADVVMIVEQDHEFIAPCPNPAAIVEIFRQRPDISYVKLNRRANVALGFDKLITQTARDRDCGITRTAGFSNTPHFVRRDYYDAIVHPAIRQTDRLDGRNSGAGGVEESVGAVIRQMFHVAGLPATTRLFGLAIWGEPGQAAICHHLGV
jgi:tetratricopeptide (TPR) repeat protein